jgi:pyruvate dehydrogenase complex dehydrogenase (E1) component
MSTTNALDDRFDDAERGLEWLEKLEALQARSASDRAAYEVAEYVMQLRAAVTELAGDRTASELSEAVGAETAQLVEELRWVGGNDYWNTRIRPALLKSDP